MEGKIKNTIILIILSTIVLIGFLFSNSALTDTLSSKSYSLDQTTNTQNYDIEKVTVKENVVTEDPYENHRVHWIPKTFSVVKPDVLKKDTNVSIKVKKNWVSKEESKPSVTFTVLQDGNPLKDSSKTLNPGEDELEFTNLERYRADGTEYKYTIEETPLEKYTSTNNYFYDKDGYDIEYEFTNTIKQEKVSFVVNKQWDDLDNLPKRSHPNINISLYRDNVKVDTKSMSIPNNKTSVTFDNLDKYDLSDGHEYKYSAKEEEAEDLSTYESIISDSTPYSETITNRELKFTLEKTATSDSDGTIPLKNISFNENTKSANFYYVLTLTSNEKTNKTQTVTDTLPSGITANTNDSNIDINKWKTDNNVSISSDNKTINWSNIDFKNNLVQKLVIPVTTTIDSLTRPEGNNWDVVNVSFSKPADDISHTRDSSATGKINVFLRSLDIATPQTNNGYIYAGQVNATNAATELSDKEERFINNYNDTTINAALQNSNTAKELITNLSAENNQMSRYFKDGLPSNEFVNSNLKNIYFSNKTTGFELTNDEEILWYKFSHYEDPTLDRNYIITDANGKTLYDYTKDGAVVIPNCTYHIDGLIVRKPTFNVTNTVYLNNSDSRVTSSCSIQITDGRIQKLTGTLPSDEPITQNNNSKTNSKTAAQAAQNVNTANAKENKEANSTNSKGKANSNSLSKNNNTKIEQKEEIKNYANKSSVENNTSKTSNTVQKELGKDIEKEKTEKAEKANISSKMTSNENNLKKTNEAKENLKAESENKTKSLKKENLANTSNSSASTSTNSNDEKVENTKTLDDTKNVAK